MSPPKRVCLISIEVYSKQTVGGFGRASRVIGRELVKRGIEVTIVAPRRVAGSPDVFELDGMTVRQFNPFHPWAAVALYRQCEADVYHSQDTSLGTRLAMFAQPGRKHVITFRDPMDERDWEIETRYAGQGRVGWALYRAFVDGPFVASAVSRAHGRYCAAEFLRAKVRRKYGLTEDPGFLPTPVHVPLSVEKASRPTVCYVGRWEGRKRPERFFELAGDFPHVDFIAVGGAQDPERDAHLRRTYGDIKNLQMTGFVDQFQSGELFQVLSKSWVMINSSAREGLPNAFLEGCAHRCALLSYSDPDQFVSRFGHVATDEDGGLHKGLEALLVDHTWRQRGEQGHELVNRVFATDRAMDAHLSAYDRL